MGVVNSTAQSPPPRPPIGPGVPQTSWLVPSLLIGFAVAMVVASALFLPAAVGTGCNPEPHEVVVGILSVSSGCLAAGFTGYLARYTRNPFHLITTVGIVVLVAGIVGQHAFHTTQNAQMALACPATVVFGPWSSSIQFPGTNLTLSPVAMVGGVIMVIGLCAVLVVESMSHVPDRVPEVPAHLDDADTI